MGSALLRDAHVRLDPPPWILEDRLAAMLLNDDEVEELERPLRDWPSDVVRALRVQHVVRTRVAEDTAAAGLDRGRTSYVLLGAGADTFAWRHPVASRFTVWEYDLPATQAWKRHALRRAGLVEPSNVRFVPIDLATDPFGELPRSATWSWLGVTMYLAADVVSRTLRTIAACGVGTTLVVNFVLPDVERDDLARETARRSSALVSTIGEPVMATWGRQEARDLLRSSGFRTVEILDASALDRRYLNGRTDLRFPGSTIIAVAST
jgi:methyltransferase (TIGR00027 family)